MTDSIKVLNEFLPKAETERLGAIKVGDTLDLDTNNVLNVNESATPKAYMTNCITEIPQDIHYELSNGVLTLKAGSSAYMPDGFESDGTTPKFTKVTSTADISYTPTWGAGYKCLLTAYVNDSGNISGIGMCRNDLQVSGETAPTATIGGTTWYDTATNKIKVWRDDVWKYDTTTEHRCLFLGKVTVSDGNTITSIDQVFNGFGYIGSTVFALPGVKGIIPNGRNEDGTLNNIGFEQSKVSIYTFSGGYTGSMVLGINATNGFDCDTIYFTEQTNRPSDNNWTWLNPETNKLICDGYAGPDSYVDHEAQCCIFMNAYRTLDKIDWVNFKKPIRMADTYDINEKLAILQDTKLDTSRIQYVSAVPGNPQDGVIYLIAQ